MFPAISVSEVVNAPENVNPPPTLKPKSTAKAPEAKANMPAKHKILFFILKLINRQNFMYCLIIDFFPHCV
ncbi:hypothetical protein FACS1894163_02800 [Spirochaetia bacterium]|nr:hypothetical protein FACS1894163_02800 [Spirochaetia bacterium]